MPGKAAPNRYAHWPVAKPDPHRGQLSLERDAILARIRECQQAVASADSPPSWGDL